MRHFNCAPRVVAALGVRCGLRSSPTRLPFRCWPNPRRQAGRPARPSGRPGQRQKRSTEGRRICRSPARPQRPGRQSRMRVARPAGGEPALARRPRHRLPPPRSLRPLRLPERPYPGDVPLPGSARQCHRSEGRRQPERPGPCVLDQSLAAGCQRRPRATAAPRPVAAAALQAPPRAADRRSTAALHCGEAILFVRRKLLVLNLPLPVASLLLPLAR